MVRIRLQRLGRPHRPFYRINAVDQRTKRDGKFIEEVGWYDPMVKDPSKQLSLNAERIKHWLSVGAQPSDTVADMLVRNNLLPNADAWRARRAARAEASRRAKAPAPAGEQPATPA